jgi:nucleotide-binding universal stress UspA family protein
LGRSALSLTAPLADDQCVIERFSAKYTGVVVAVDPVRIDAAALAVGTTLGAALGDIELMTVVPLGGHVAESHAALEQAAQRSGVSAIACTVLERDDAPGTLIEHAGDDRLLVIGCRPTHPMWLPALGDVGRRVLAAATHPVLVVGPAVTSQFDRSASLIVCAHRGRPSALTLDAVERWVHTFGSEQTWVADVIPTSIDIGGDGAATVRTWVDALAERNLVGRDRTLNGGDPVEWLEDFAADFTAAVYVTASDRYTDGRRHLRSTTRDLIRRGRHPVLVVPDRSRTN